MKIDSHHHLWAINDTDYVWMTERHATLRRDFLSSDLDAVLDASGLDGSVVVQARQMNAETDFLLAVAGQNPRIKAVVGWVPLCEDGCQEALEHYAAHPKLRGVRHVIHDEPDDHFISRPDFNAGVKRLGKHGLVYDILIFPKHLPQTVRMVDQHPSQGFVVDHMAKPQIQRGSFDHAWAHGIRELALREQVSCKVSGVLTEVRDTNWDLELIQPYFDTILQAFGTHRVMFGSDWPVCLLRSSHHAWTAVCERLTASLSDHEKASFWGMNAKRIYGF